MSAYTRPLSEIRLRPWQSSAARHPAPRSRCPRAPPERSAGLWCWCAPPKGILGSGFYEGSALGLPYIADVGCAEDLGSE